MPPTASIRERNCLRLLIVFFPILFPLLFNTMYVMCLKPTQINFGFSKFLLWMPHIAFGLGFE